MRRKIDRESDARNRLFFEPLEPRELLAADSGFEWWSSWDSGAEDAWAWTFDDSWAAETGGDASWDTGFWDGAWWEDDTSWQFPDDGGFDPGSYDWANDLGGDAAELVFDTDAYADTDTDANADTDTSTLPNDPSIPDPSAGYVASNEPSATADPPAVESDIGPTTDAAPTTDAITGVTADSEPTATFDPVETECTTTEDCVIDDTVGDDIGIEDLVLEAVAVEVTDRPDAAGDGAPPADDTAVDAWTPDELPTDIGDIDPAAVGDQTDVTAGWADDESTPTYDTPATDDDSVVVPIPAAGGPSRTGEAPAANGRGELFRAWGAFFIPGFAQSTATADGQAAGLQAEAGVPVGRPRIRLPFRPAR